MYTPLTKGVQNSKKNTKMLTEWYFPIIIEPWEFFIPSRWQGGVFKHCSWQSLCIHHLVWWWCVLWSRNGWCSTSRLSCVCRGRIKSSWSPQSSFVGVSVRADRCTPPIPLLSTIRAGCSLLCPLPYFLPSGALLSWISWAKKGKHWACFVTKKFTVNCWLQICEPPLLASI